MHSTTTTTSTLHRAVGAVLFAGTLIVGGLIPAPPALAQSSDAQMPALGVGGAPVNFAGLAKQVVPSVVSVFSTDIVKQEQRRPMSPFEFFFGPGFGQQGAPQERVQLSAGSGFFISSDGEVLTNNHVIKGADKIEIELKDGTRHAVKVIGRDPDTDIALLKVEKPDRSYPVLPFGDSDSMEVGNWVMAVGNPLLMQETVTVGVVSAKGRQLGLSAQTSSFENFIQTDAAINFGNSGGPLVNIHGQAIGINTAINAQAQNIGFAIPINMAKRILPQLRTKGRVIRGYLGASVSDVTPQIQSAFDLPDREGAFVQSVQPGQAAAKAGLEHGDVIIKVNGNKVKDAHSLIEMISSEAPESEITLDVLRNGKHEALTATLGERPSGEKTASQSQQSGGASTQIGLTVTDLTPQVRQELGISGQLEGVVITDVNPVSPAAEAGLAPGDVITEVNGKDVTSVDEMRSTVDQAKPGAYLRFYVYRPRADASFYAIVKVPS